MGIRESILVQTFEFWKKRIWVNDLWIYRGLKKYLKENYIKMSDIESVELVEATIRERKKGEHNKRQIIKMLLNGYKMIEFEITFYEEMFANM